MILDAIALDWATLTSWETSGVSDLSARLSAYCEGDVAPARRMQYDGVLYPAVSTFLGQALQRNKMNTMLIATGENTELALSAVERLAQWRPTRVDVQVTMEVATSSVMALVDMYRDSSDAEHVFQQSRGQRARKPRLILNYDGYCTLYRGANKSDKQTRVYTKVVMPERAVVRWELQTRRALSVAAYRHSLPETKRAFGALWAEDVLTAAESPLRSIFAPFAHDVQEGHVKVPRYRNDEDSRLLWLHKTAVPSLLRALNDHHTRERALQLVDYIVQRAQEIVDDE